MSKEVSSTLEEIKKLLNHEKCVPCKNNTLVIREPAHDAKLKSINIIIDAGKDSFFNESTFHIKYDECGFPGEKLFNSDKSLGLLRACDAIAFCMIDGQGYILCCELKSSEPKINDVARQFRNAQCFLIYLNSILKHYLNQSIENWQHRYFVFHLEKTPINDDTPKPKNLLINNAPEKALFVEVNNGASIKLRSLLNREM